MLKHDTKKLKKILSHPQIATILNQQSLDSANNAVLIIENQLSPQKNKGALSVEEAIKSIGGTLNLLLHLAIEKPVTPIMKDLADEFIILASYWNENIGKDLRIRSSAYDLRRFIDYHLSVMDIIQVAKTLLKRMEQVQNFSPPSFELSKHYLRALESLNNEKINKKLNKKQCPTK
jgi:hypothetical protein